MHRIDDAELMRVRAHQIWEREGRPQGREHEHWAEAARELAAEVAIAPAVRPDRAELPRDSEVERLRRALYEPSEFSAELFGHEAPLPVTRPRTETLRAAGLVSQRQNSVGAARSTAG